MGSIPFILAIWIAAASPSSELPWNELALSIEEDRSVSSDHATLCLVRVVNGGRGTWQGRNIRFEARAFRDGRLAARQGGRFGLTLGPRETLETRVGFVGRFDRFEVVPGGAGVDEGGGGRKKKSRSRKPKSSSRRRS